jgi:hypothetical protein
VKFARLLVPLAALIGFALPACADDRAGAVYESGADGGAQVEAALAEASARGVPALIVFGANWCHDSRGFADRVLNDAALAPFMAEHYALAFIDIGMRHRNLDQAERLGVEAIFGTPTLVIADADGAVLNTGTVHDWRAVDGAGDADLLAYFARFAGAGWTGEDPVYAVSIQTAVESWPPYVRAVESWLAAFEAGEIDAQTLGANAAYAGGLARSLARNALGREGRARDEALVDANSLIHLGIEPDGERTAAVIERMAGINMDIAARQARDRADTEAAMTAD